MSGKKVKGDYLVSIPSRGVSGSATVLRWRHPARKVSEMRWEEHEFCQSPLPLSPVSMRAVCQLGRLAALSFSAPWLRPGGVKRSGKIMAWPRSSSPGCGMTKLKGMAYDPGRRQSPPACPPDPLTSFEK